jgi:hypothetical protein
MDVSDLLVLVLLSYKPNRGFSSYNPSSFFRHLMKQQKYNKRKGHPDIKVLSIRIPNSEIFSREELNWSNLHLEFYTPTGSSIARPRLPQYFEPDQNEGNFVKGILSRTLKDGRNARRHTDGGGRDDDRDGWCRVARLGSPETPRQGLTGKISRRGDAGGGIGEASLWESQAEITVSR